MNTLQRSDILSAAEFAKVRPAHERAVLEAKRLRRVLVGPNLIFLFENHATLRWQVHEMCRVEGIQAESGVAHELETYGALMPRQDSLSVTLLIAFPDPDVRDRRLRELHGLHQHVWLEVEGHPRIPAQFDDAQFDGERVSSVQFIRFPLSPAAREGLASLSIPVRLVVDHPSYRAQTPLAPTTRAALIEDLA